MKTQKLNNEVVIKIVDNLIDKEPLIDCITVRSVVENILNDYDIYTKKYQLTKTDIPDKIYLYLVSKKLEGLSDSTLKNYKYLLDLFAAAHYNRCIDTITQIDIKVFLAKILEGKKISLSTYETYIACYKSFYSWLSQQEYITKNVMNGIKYPKRNKNLRKALTLEQIEQLRDSCLTYRERALLEFLLSTGCRVSELVGLSVSDIDWSRMTFSIIGKGRKERKCYFTSKTRYYLEKYLKIRKGIQTGYS
nr:tyrosine-type recombinase/integrase [Vallitalea guaymasensis]